MSNIEQFYKNCKTFETTTLLQIEHHIKAHNIYTAFDFGKLHSDLTKYETWAQANSRAIDEALKVPRP